MTTVYAVAALILLVIVVYISMQNNIKSRREKVDESLAKIDAALAKRYDTLTKLLELTNGYATDELEPIPDTARPRKGMTTRERDHALAELDRIGKAIRPVAERYPALVSDAQYAQLHSDTADCAEQLQAARRAYNANISAYNRLLRVFPTSLVASIQGNEPLALWETYEEKGQDANTKA